MIKTGSRESGVGSRGALDCLFPHTFAIPLDKPSPEVDGATTGMGFATRLSRLPTPEASEAFRGATRPPDSR